VLEAETNEPRLQAIVELQLMRICQEALCNIRKHSGAKNIDVKVTSVNHHLEVSIIDDGCGFESLSYCSSNTRCPSHGLDIMRERTESIGGNLRILSTPGEGTEIHVKVPVNSRRVKLPWVSL
jgi:signal transduction histidine kinase